jgi:hypothetical protein
LQFFHFHLLKLNVAPVDGLITDQQKKEEMRFKEIHIWKRVNDWLD